MNATPHATSTMTRGMVMLFAFCCGAIVANIYYAQPIIELIAPDIGLTPAMASLIVSLTQIGYALGLFFLVPLGDLLENRKLMILTTVVAIASLLGAAFTEQPNLFLLVSLLIGFSSVSVQILIPLAAHLAPAESRGRVVGSIMGGLLLGILLARPVSSVVADHFGWRAMFMAAAGLMAFISVVLMLTIPKRQPDHSASYGQLLGSLGTLLRRQPVLRQRAFYQGCMFATFSLFWTAVPLELARNHGLSQSEIALFALVGAIGRHRRAHRRAPGGCRSHSPRFVAGDAVRGVELPACVRASAVQRDRPGGNRCGPGLLRADEHGPRPTRHLRPRRQ